MSHVQAALRVIEWKTIDSAPKDGMMLVFGGKGEYEIWSAKNFWMARNSDAPVWMKHLREPAEAATHWAMLPEPPTT